MDNEKTCAYGAVLGETCQTRIRSLNLEGNTLTSELPILPDADMSYENYCAWIH